MALTKGPYPHRDVIPLHFRHPTPFSVTPLRFPSSPRKRGSCHVGVLQDPETSDPRLRAVRRIGDDEIRSRRRRERNAGMRSFSRDNFLKREPFLTKATVDGATALFANPRASANPNGCRPQATNQDTGQSSRGGVRTEEISSYRSRHSGLTVSTRSSFQIRCS